MPGRNPNSLDTVRIKVSTNPIIEGYLEQLAETGLYGKNGTEAAERLIAEGIGRLLDRNILERAPSTGRRRKRKVPAGATKE